MTQTDALLAQRLRFWGAWLERHSHRLAWLAVGLFTVVVSWFTLAKYAVFGHNGLDLAIYTQVVSETARGNLFGLTIHPHAYLGDHVELILLALAPLARVFSTAPMLLVAQTIALGLGGIAAFRIGQRLLSPRAGLALTLATLWNPIMLNTALFEFHALAFAIPIVLWALDAYTAKRLGRYLLWIVLALMVREDVALAVMGLGLLALIDRRRWQWSIIPLLLGAAWFVTTMQIASHLNGYGQYKFLRYYGWLGSSWREVGQTLALHPLRWLPAFGSVQTLALVVGALAPVGFLPLLRLRWLVPITPIFVQLALLWSGGLTILQIHYGALLVPFLVVGAAAGVAALPRARWSWVRRMSSWRAGLLCFLVAVAMYFGFAIGPAWSAPHALRKIDRENVALQQAFVDRVSPAASVATTFAPLAQLADRPRIYSLNYVFLGRKQFSEDPYELPADVDTLLIDLDDLLRFHLIYPENEFQGLTGAQRLQAVIDRGFGLVAWEDHMTLWERGASGLPPLAERLSLAEPVGTRPPLATFGDKVRLLGFSGGGATGTLAPEQVVVGSRTVTALPFQTSWTVTETPDTEYELAFRLYRDNALAFERRSPLGNGLLPSTAWRPGETILTRQRVRLPATLPAGTYEARIAIGETTAFADVDGLRSITVSENFKAEGEASVGTVVLAAGKR